jgi:dihydroflavonol-4-reductase
MVAFGAADHIPALEGLAVQTAAGAPDDPVSLQQAMEGCQVVFHTAGYAPPNRFRHPRRLLEARQHIDLVLDAAREAAIGRLVYTSSVCTIGRSDIPTRLPDEWNGYHLGQVLHPYWDAKLVQEEAVLAFGREGDVPVVVLNPVETVGPYDFDLQAARPLMDLVRRGTRQYVPGRISMADARDVAQGHLAAAERGRPGERYILAGHNLTRREMAAIMARACKRPPPDRPVALRRLERMTRLSEQMACMLRPNRQFPSGYEVEAALRLGWYEGAKAREELGYTNRPLISTYRATLAWLRAVRVLK